MGAKARTELRPGTASADGVLVIESRGLLDIAVWLPDAVVVVDASARLIWANDAAERLFGVDRTRLAGANGLDFLHPDDQEVAAVALTSIQRKTVGTPIELRV